MKRKLSQFWCEIFGTHDWKEIGRFKKDNLWYIAYQCRKCDKEKAEIEPIMLPSIFYPS